MKVTIEISQHDAWRLARWASVSRTMKEAARILEDLTEEELVEAAYYCAIEVRTLEPLLNRLHQDVREQLWVAEGAAQATTGIVKQRKDHTMSASRVQAIDRLINKLERWIEKRRRKQLDCSGLVESVFYLREYRDSLNRSGEACAS